MLQCERQQAQRSSGAAIRNNIKPLDEKFHFSHNELKLMIIFGYSIFDVTCFTGKDTMFVYVCAFCVVHVRKAHIGFANAMQIGIFMGNWSANHSNRNSRFDFINAFCLIFGEIVELANRQIEKFI